MAGEFADADRSRQVMLNISARDDPDSHPPQEAF
jgi:hypothetical protein